MVELKLKPCFKVLFFVALIVFFNFSTSAAASEESINTSIVVLNQAAQASKENDESEVKLVLDENEQNSNPIVVKKIEVEPTPVAEKGDVINSWITGNYATGDWNGLREQLEEKGISLQSTYVNDSFSTLSGGVNSSRRVKPLGLFDLYLNLDTEKLNMWKGGNFVTHIQSSYGKGIYGGNLETTQNNSNIDSGGGVAQVSEYYYTHRFSDDKVTIKVGKQDANADFVSFATGANYLNASYGCMPNIPLPTYPNQAIGAAIFIKPTEHITIKSGIYDGEASGSTTGFSTAFNPNNAKFMINQVSVDYSIKDHPGAVMVGGWMHTKDTDELSNSENTRTFNKNAGAYMVAEQMVYKEKKNDPHDDQGLAVFGQISYAPEDRNEIPVYYGGGLQYKGLIPKRDNDFTGIGLSVANYSSRLASMDGDNRHGSEKTLELFYKAQVNPWFVVQPDVQIISRPDGQSNTAIALGLRTVMTF